MRKVTFSRAIRSSVEREGHKIPVSVSNKRAPKPAVIKPILNNEPGNMTTLDPPRSAFNLRDTLNISYPYQPYLYRLEASMQPQLHYLPSSAPTVHPTMNDLVILERIAKSGQHGKVVLAVNMYQFYTHRCQLTISFHGHIWIIDLENASEQRKNIVKSILECPDVIKVLPTNISTVFTLATRYKINMVNAHMLPQICFTNDHDILKDSNKFAMPSLQQMCDEYLDPYASIATRSMLYENSRNGFVGLNATLMASNSYASYGVYLALQLKFPKRDFFYGQSKLHLPIDPVELVKLINSSPDSSEYYYINSKNRALAEEKYGPFAVSYKMNDDEKSRFHNLPYIPVYEAEKVDIFLGEPSEYAKDFGLEPLVENNNKKESHNEL